jgi:hypothetical protein
MRRVIPSGLRNKSNNHLDSVADRLQYIIVLIILVSFGMFSVNLHQTEIEYSSG